MGLFNRKKRVSAQTYGELLGTVLREAMEGIFDDNNLDDLKKFFNEKDWKFEYGKYSYEVMNLFAQIIQLSINSKNEFHIATDIGASFLKTLPQEYIDESEKDFLIKTMNLVKAKDPLLTSSRMAAQNYFGKVDMEAVLHFHSYLRALGELLKTFVYDKYEVR